jgi:hypothetical protein
MAIGCTHALNSISEKKYSDFTLYFLAFNHDGNQLSAQEKDKARFSREGGITGMMSLAPGYSMET